jgi:hypothetical protein
VWALMTWPWERRPESLGDMTDFASKQ